jgi:ribosome biogenesis GTPase
MIESFCGSSPVISRSIQISRFKAAPSRAIVQQNRHLNKPPVLRGATTQASHLNDVPARENHGLIVAAHGRRGKIELPDQSVWPYVTRGRFQKVVCGDRVSWSGAPGEGELRIESVEPRQNELARFAARGAREVLAANTNQMCVVLAHIPEPDPFLIDRFICAGEISGAEICLIENKIDAAPKDVDLCAEYAGLGYAVLRVSAVEGTGLGRLKNALADRVSILVGQSGVGKSSLVNALVPEMNSATAAVSAGTGEGRHTTTAVVMHRMPQGRLVDTPGVREWVPAMPDEISIQSGFREFARFNNTCRFRNCLHTREPDCAVKEAVESGQITVRRYESYRRLINLWGQRPSDR